jgi:hypothetical protein
MKQNLGAETGGTSLRKVPATARLLLCPRPAGLNFLVELGEERAECSRRRRAEPDASRQQLVASSSSSACS